MHINGLNKGPKKDGRGAMLMSDMDIGRLMTYVKQADKERHYVREEFRNKRAKISNHEVRKKGNSNKF